MYVINTKELVFITRQNLVGQKFGRLVVTKMLFNYKNTNITYCECVCDCGKEHVIKNAYDLKSGHIQSCGCLKSESIHNRCSKDITGKRFGRLVILKTYYNYKNTHKTYCDCKCDCGNTITVNRSDIVSGHTKSCGCLQKESASKSNTKDYSNIETEYGIKIIKPLYKNKHGQWIWDCICPYCKSHFEAMPVKIINGHKTSCGCILQSKGERIIKKVLDNEKIIYQSQYKFDDCRSKNNYRLRFDFAVFDSNNILSFLIEYDGQQHFKSIDYWGGEEQFRKSQERDSIKNGYCKNHNIKLIRLPYTLSQDEIVHILLKQIKLTNNIQ